MELHRGGRCACFADPDGNLWEAARDAAFPIDAQGRMALPS